MHSLSVVQPCCGPVKHTRISRSIPLLSVAQPLAARRSRSQRLCGTFVKSSVKLCRRQLRFLRRCGGIYGYRGARGQLNQRVVCGLRSAGLQVQLSSVFCLLSAVCCLLSSLSCLSRLLSCLSMDRNEAGLGERKERKRRRHKEQMM